MKILNDYERGFLEGLIDGEGCLCFRDAKEFVNGTIWHHWKVRLSISNTNLDLLRKAEEIIGKGAWAKKMPRKAHHKISWELRYGAATLRWLLPQLNLVAKRDTEKRVLEALTLIKKRNRFVQGHQNELEKLVMQQRNG